MTTVRKQGMEISPRDPSKEAEKKSGLAPIIITAADIFSNLTGSALLYRVSKLQNELVEEKSREPALFGFERSFKPSDEKQKTTQIPFAALLIAANQEAFGRKGGKKYPPSVYSPVQLHCFLFEILLGIETKTYTLIEFTPEKLVFEIKEEEKKFEFCLDLTKSKSALDQLATKKSARKFMVMHDLSYAERKFKDQMDKQWSNSEDALYTLYPVSYKEKDRGNDFIPFEVLAKNNDKILTSDLDTLGITVSPQFLSENLIKKHANYGVYAKKYHYGLPHTKERETLELEFFNLCHQVNKDFGFNIDDQWIKKEMSSLQGDDNDIISPFLLLASRYLKICDCTKIDDQTYVKKCFEELCALYGQDTQNWIDNLDEYIKKAGRITAYELFHNRIVNHCIPANDKNRSFSTYFFDGPLQHGPETNHPEEKDRANLSSLDDGVMIFFPDTKKHKVITQSEYQLANMCLQLANQGHYIRIHPLWDMNKWASVVEALLKHNYKHFIDPTVFANYQQYQQAKKTQLMPLKLQPQDVFNLAIKLISIPLYLIKKVTVMEIKLLRLFFTPAIYIVDKFLALLSTSAGTLRESAKYLLSLTLTLTVSLPLAIAKRFLPRQVTQIFGQITNQIMQISAERYEELLNLIENRFRRILQSFGIQIQDSQPATVSALQQIFMQEVGKISAASTTFILRSIMGSPSSSPEIGRQQLTTQEATTNVSEEKREVVNEEKMEEVEEIKEKIKEEKNIGSSFRLGRKYGE